MSKFLILFTIMTMFGYLSQAQTLFSVTGGGTYCEGGAGVEVGLDGSEDTKNYELYLNGVTTGTIVTGDGNPISFGNQTAAGTYTVKLVTPETLMTGDVDVTIETTPVSGTLTKTPDLASVCSGTTTNVSATLTPGSGGNGTDELEYRTHDGTSWSVWATYTSGTDIPTLGKIQIEIQTRRVATSCTSAAYNTVSWTVETTPISGILTKVPDKSIVCLSTANVSATLTSGSGGNGTDELEYRTHDGTSWSAWAAYTSGTDIATLGKTQIEIQTRRLATECTNADYNSVNWILEATPVSGILNKTPDLASVCSGTTTNVSATLTPGSGGNGTDELEYRTHDGTSWSAWAAYTSGTDIATLGKTQIEIQTRRLASDCTNADYNTVNWIVEATPVSGTLNKTPDLASVCSGTTTNVSATLTPGSGGNGTDELEYRTHDGTSWSVWAAYTSGTDIATAGKTSIEIQTRRIASVCTSAGYNTVLWNVDTPSVGGDVTGGTLITSGSASGELLLSGHTGAVQRWQYSTDAWVTPNDIIHTGTTYTSGPLTETTQFRAVVQNGVCPEANSTATTVTVDGTAPTVTITSDLGATTNISPFGITIVFSEEVIGFAEEDFTVSNGGSITPGSLSTSNNITFTATVTAPASDALISISIAADKCTDIAGNGNIVSNTLEVDYYTTSKPTLSTTTIASNNSFNTQKAIVGNTVTLSFSSSRALDNVVVTIAGQSIFGANLTSSPNDRDWTAVYEMTSAYSDGDVSFSINFTDAAGTAGDEVTNLNFGGTNVVFDKTPPSAPNVIGTTPTTDQTPTWSWTPQGGGAGRYRYGYSEGSWIQENVTATSYTPGSNLSEGDYTLYVQERDDVGNWSSSGSLTISVDLHTETPDLILPASNSTSGSNVNIEFDLPEAALGGTVKMIFTDQGGHYLDRIVTFKPVFETAGIHSATLNGNDLEDNSFDDVVLSVYTDGTAGKKLFNGITYTVTIEYQDVLGNTKAVDTNTDFFYGLPLAEIIDVAPDPRNTGVSSVQVTFTRRVLYSAVNKSDFSLTRNGSNVDLSGIPAITYDDINGSYARNYYLDLSSVTNQEGAYELRIIALGSGIVDYQGNELAEDSTDTWYCDKTPPTLTYSSSVSSPTNVSPFNVTANISEATNDFELSDIDASNATTSGFVVNSPTSYTFTVTPQNEGLLTLNVPIGTYTDLVTNSNTTASQINIVYDGTSPEPIITSTLSSPTNQSTIPIKVDFGETVTGFTAGDITVAGATISGFTTTNNKVFTFNLTSPSANPTININAGVCTDIAGNSNTAASQFSIVYDVAAPTLNSVTIVSNQTPNTLVRVGRKVTLSFSSLESLTNVDVSIHGNSVTATSSDGKSWIASYTFTDEDNPEGQVSFTIDFDDLAGNSGTQVTTISTGNNVNFDKTKPGFSNITFTNNPSGAYSKEGGIITLTFNSSESTNTPTVTVNGLAATVTGGPTAWSASRTLGASDAEGLIPYTITANDLAGNVSDGISAYSSITFDKTPPSISSVTVPAGSYKVGDIIVVTISADDKNYLKSTLTINGKDLALVNNNDNTYKVNYQIQATDTEHSNVATLPVNIVLADLAGNTNAAILSANVVGGTLSIDSGIPIITNVSTYAEDAGNLIIGDTIIFRVFIDDAELNLDINPKLYNGQSLTWLTEDGGSSYTATYTVQEDEPSHVSTPLQLGDVTATDLAGNISSFFNYSLIQKLIFASRPTATITGSTVKCEDGSTEPITFNFTGTPPYILKYKNEGVTYGPFNVPTNSYVVDIMSGTCSLDTLWDNTGNFQLTAEQEATITINPLPTVTFNIPSPYYNLNDIPIDFKTYVSPPNGVFTGLGVQSNGIFYPEVVGEEDNQIEVTITYTYVDGNGCENSDDQLVTVTSGLGTLRGVDEFYCQYQEPDTVIGSNPTENPGVFTFSSVEGFAVINDSTAVIYPGELLAGSHWIKYSYVENDLDFHIERSFTIDSIGANVNFTGLLDQYCENSIASSLVAVDLYPAGGAGHFSGPAGGFFTVENSNQALFEPSNLTPDQTYMVSYFYESPLGCYSDTIEKEAIVSSLPDVNFYLNHNYNYNDPQVNLMDGADPQGGVFSGVGIIDGTLLRPDLVAPGTTTNIKYTYVDPATGCSNDISKSTIVLRASEVIQGLNSEYCYSEDLITITCSPNFDPAIEGVFSSTKVGAITSSTNPNEAMYSIAAAGKGVDTVYYRYTIEGTNYEVFKRVVIDSIGQVSIEGLDLAYCNDAQQVILIGDYNDHEQGFGAFTYSGTPAAFVNQGNLAYFFPLQEQPGDFTFTYKYNSNLTSCSSQVTSEVRINPIPDVHFAISQSCSDLSSEPVQFINNTVSVDEIDSWSWNFDGQGTSNDFEPTFLFTTSGDKLINLEATTINGCSVDIDSTIVVGVVPKANFSWKFDCLTGQSTEFSSTADPTNIANYQWIFDGGSIIEGEDMSDVSHLFTELGNHDVKLVLTSNDNCKDSTVKQVFIQPLIKIHELLESFYIEDFEEGEGYWNAKGISEVDHSSWDFGTPNGSDINEAASGTNAWFTVIDMSNQMVEKSQVISPCFDLQLLEKPMLKFNIWSLPDEGRDGAVLQYDLDGENNWQNLGTINQGINWFNSSTIQSQPGGAGQFFGWSSIRMDEWTSARISLDDIKNAENVRFRIAYAADGNAINSFEGFAFDDFWIGNREKQVLIEYFTNNSTDANIGSDNYIVNLENSNQLDLNAVHYHSSIPTDDPLHSYYPSGPLAREFFYSLSAVPYALINGQQALNLQTTTNNQNLIDKETLEDPLFNLSINCDGSNSININVDAKALQNYSGLELVLHCAIVQKELDFNAPSGVDKFYNVLRAFLPDPGGTTMANSMSLGQVSSMDFSWTPSPSDNASKSRVVVFVQNINTGEIYQSAYFDLSNITSSPYSESSFDVNLYPNPASETIWIESPVIVDRVIITDLAGRVLDIQDPNSHEFTVSLDSYNSGMYIVKVITRKGDVVKKVIKQ